MNPTMIILLLVMVIAFYFLIMRPQRKRQQQQQSMLKTLEPGTRVMTTTGIYGTVVASGDNQLVLQISPESRMTVLKRAVAKIVNDDEEDAELRSYQAETPRVPDDLSGLAEAQTGQEYGFDHDSGQAWDTGAESSDSDADASASGMAGGAPIQEYTPGQTPDFSEPEHATAPWPTAGQTPGTGDGSGTGQDDPGSYDDFGGSVLGGSSLGSGSDPETERGSQG